MLYLGVLLLFIISLGFSSEVIWGQVLVIDLLIVWLYMIDRPLFVFHPNNMVVCYHILYVVVPSLIYLFYQYFDISYTLPWAPPDWLSFNPLVYVEILFVYVILYGSFSCFTKNIKYVVIPEYKISNFVLGSLIAVLVALLFCFINGSGGWLLWVQNYQKVYLTNREGLGVINFFIIYLSTLVSFLLGLKLKKIRNKIIYVTCCVLFLLFLSYFQGLKSKFIILIVIFISPWLYKVKLTYKKITLTGVVFLIFLVFANYLRSDGFYNTTKSSIEYFMTYFNVLYLQDKVLHCYQDGFIQTIYFPIVKYMQFFLGVDPDANFDLSVMLTKVFFPAQWYVEKGTQQWPLITDLYFNWYDMYLGWIPLILYAAIISKLYRCFCASNLWFWPIYLLEFFRIFTTLRSTLIPWDILVMLFFYILIYLIMSKAVYVKK
jgi:hypothetical protein